MRATFFSYVYRLIRFIVTKTLYFIQSILFIPKDLEPAVKIGDSVMSSISIIGKPFFDFKIPAKNQIELFELKFPSPLIAASFKSDYDILSIWMRMGLGSVTFKTIMKDIRFGNNRPRLQDASLENEKGLLNSMGLPGPGIEKFKQTLSDINLQEFNRPLGISIGGDSASEYVYIITQIENALIENPYSYFYELNISCPNTVNGQTIGDNPNELELLLTQVREFTDKPISIKISPDLSNERLIEIGEICLEFDRILINTGNTHYKKPSDVHVIPENFSMNAGGFSGPALFNRTLEMVKLFSQFNTPIIATGGISTIEHVRSLQSAGAILFGMATALVFDPYCIPKINYKL